MIAVLAEIHVKAGEEAEFEEAVRVFAAHVRDNEPGNRQYRLGKSRRTPRLYTMIESYSDAEALEAHAKSEHFRAFSTTIGSLLEQAPRIEYLDVVC
ncbi:putative quinol monooxygenase [Tsukamurella sp. 1534]|uniref:putative quinol monooxygenase n=1 Tax=Tsukamurella sp. 1534 TaxID=1151061 RepID=UPI0002F66D39|nr:putative quinol monooxygenase [Tsukamurella sp. 1534]